MMNNVSLIGRLARDPELKSTPGGNSYARVTLAVARNFVNDKNEREADFIHCVAWEKKAEIIAEYLRKGSLVGISGEIRTRMYEDESKQKKYITEIRVNDVNLLEKKNGTDNRDAAEPKGNSDPTVENEDFPF